MFYCMTDLLMLKISSTDLTQFSIALLASTGRKEAKKFK